MKPLILFMFSLVVLHVNGQSHWYKGNTHSHTTYSDGKNIPSEVIASYHNHGYNFLLVTDHNFLLKSDTVKIPANLRKDFLLIHGEEVSDKLAIHTTAFNISTFIPLKSDPKQNPEAPDNPTASWLLQNHVDDIIKAGGIPFLNHPNFSKGIQVNDILQVKNLRHFELYNGHPTVYNWGKEGHIPVEAKWDSILSHGVVMYGVASDDLHQLTDKPDKAGMFRGWIMVNSRELTTEDIHKSIAAGNFYATTSVILKTCNISENKFIIKVDLKATENEVKHSFGTPRIDKEGTEGYKIEFIGQNGKVLYSVNSDKANYSPKKEDKYVRARITHCVKTNEGYEKLFAWTQPVFIK